MDRATALLLLEISPDATAEEANKAYKELMRVWHPDNFANKPDLLERATAKTKRLNEAWDTLFARQEAQKPKALKDRVVSGSPLAIHPWVVFGITLVVLGSLAGVVIATDLFNPELRLEKNLVERAYLANRHLPLVLDPDTELSAVFSGPGRKFTYVYKVVNYTKDQVGQTYFDSLRENLKKNFPANVEKDRNLAYLVANKIVLNYSFKDKDGADIITLEIRPEEYQTY